MEIKEGYYVYKSTGAYLKVVGFHESGDPLVNAIFEDKDPFRVHPYEFEKNYSPIEDSVIEALERQTCGRRYTKGEVENPDFWYTNKGYRTCSYCGSIHPDDVVTILKEEGIGTIKPTTKGYKLYVDSSKGHFKYYRPHDTDELIEVYNKLVEEHNSK